MMMGLTLRIASGAVRPFTFRVLRCADALARTAGPPACKPRIERARIRKQRAQRSFVTGSGVGQPPPPEREVDLIRIEQGQPVLGEHRIGIIVVRVFAAKPELAALSAQQLPAILRRGTRR